MARIDIAELTQHATVLGSRVLEVQQDPAVQKAWKEATVDVATATKSVANAFIETRAAWRRSDVGGAAGLAPLLA